MKPNRQMFRRAFVACALLGIIAVRAQAEQNPIPGTSLVPTAWYQSDRGVTTVSGAVSVWVDQSGNGNHASQGTSANRPSVVASALPNGKPTLRFDGNDRLVFATGLLSQNWTCFAVARPDWDNNQKAFLCGNNGSFEWRIKRNGDNPPGVQNVLRRGVVQLLNGSAQVPTDSYSLLSVRHAERLPALDITLRLNRAPDGFGTVSATTLTVPTTEIGGFEYFRGDIAAMVVFTNSLSNAEVEAVENYLHSWYTQYPPTVISLR